MQTKENLIVASADALASVADAFRYLEQVLAQIDARVAKLEDEQRAVNAVTHSDRAARYISPAMNELLTETRSHVETATAARWLNRSPQTLRKWACYEDGPIRPVRVHGRLMWAVAEITAVLDG